MSAERRDEEHLDAGTLVAFIDGALSREELAAAESHLAECASCRGDAIAAARFTRRRAPARRWFLPAAAAAAVVLFAIVGRAPDRAPSETITREPILTATVSPVAVSPRGAVDRAGSLVWTSVPSADLYRITIFDDVGRAIYETQTRDTTVVIPTTIILRPRVSYFWKLEAQTGWNRWVPSELVEFSIGKNEP